MLDGEFIKVRNLLAGLIAFSAFLVLASLADASFKERDEINSAIQAKGGHWFAEETSISKLLPEERKKRLGAFIPVATQEPLLSAPDSHTSFSPYTAAAPASLDWRNYNANNYVTPVRDQGNCGSCWAFATTAALESNVLISGEGALDLSEQILISCSGAGSCNGGYIDGASTFIRNTGLPPESYYPYTATNGSCSNAAAGWQSNTHQISGWNWVATTSPTVSALKDWLYNYGPLVTTMDVYSDFFYYSGGVYTYTSGSYQGGHAILLVGYDDTNQYFIVKNSWGSGWGESGYFKIAYSELSSVVSFGQYTIAYYTGGGSTTYSISGTVTSSGRALAGVTVALSGAASKTTTTNTSGSYSFTGLANGSYTITPSKTGYTLSPLNKSVTVNSANVTGQNFTATSGGGGGGTYSITGTVTSGGRALAGVTVALSGAASKTTTTNTSGSYSFTGLANGSYTITPSKTGYTFTPASKSVTVNSANVTGQNFTAASGGGGTYSITGTVTSGGRALAGVTVALSGAASKTTTTNTLGKYTFTGLANGSYTITPSKTGYTFSPTNKSVTVNSANVTGQNFMGTR